MPAPSPIGEAIMAAARDAFDKRKRSFIDVPEWKIDGPDGKKVAARIWYDPISMEEYQDLWAWRREDGQHYAMAHAVVVKATDEQGNRLFTAEHEIAFCKMVDADPVYRIAKKILGVADDPKATEKN